MDQILSVELERKILQRSFYSEIRCIAQRVFSYFEGILGFSFPSIILVKAGLMQINRLLKKSEGNRNGGWIFCRRKEAAVALFSQVTRMRKIRRICEANLTSRLLLPETRRSQSNKP